MLKYELMEYGIKIGTVEKMKQYSYSEIENMLNNHARIKGITIECLYKIVDAYKTNNLKDETLSVFDLIEFGLSVQQATSIFEANLTIDDLLNLEDIYSYSLSLQLKKRLENIIPDYFEYLRNFHNLNYKLKSTNSSYLLFNIKKCVRAFESISIPMLRKKLFENNVEYDYDFLMSDINELASKSEIFFDSQGLYYKIPTLREKINQLEPRNAEILLMRFNGDSLESIGQKIGVSRERVRQLIIKSLSKMGHVPEDKYQKIFDKYDWTYEFFNTVYSVPYITYGYLDNNCVDRRNRLDIEEIFNDDEFEIPNLDELRKKIGYFEYQGELIKRDKESIFEVYILKNFDKPMRLDILYENMKQVFEECLVPIDMDIRAFAGWLDRRRCLIVGKNSTLRYYNYDDVSEEDKKALSEAMDVDYGEYSTKLFYELNPELMDNLDIKDEYELHNLIRKLSIDNSNNEVELERIPHLLIGYKEKKEFYNNILHELSPISLNDAAREISKQYGQREDTLKGYILNEFKEYIDNKSIISFDYEELDDDLILEIKNKMTKDYIDIRDAKNYFEMVLGKQWQKYFNAYNLNKMEYKMNSGYIIKYNSPTIDEYVADYVASKKSFNKDDILGKNNFIYNALYELESNYDIIRISEDSNTKYITISALNNIGITKDKIKSYADEMIQAFDENEYFTLKLAREKKYIDELEELGFDDVFYESIIHYSNKVKSFNICNNKVFYKFNGDERKFSYDFVYSYVEENESIYIPDLIKLLEEKYGMIDLKSDIIIGAAQKKGCYYSNTFYKLYVDKEKYYDELYGGNND